jgi:hypothetical protein
MVDIRFVLLVRLCARRVGKQSKTESSVQAWNYFPVI